MSRKSWFLFLLSGLLWGVPYLFIAVAVKDFHPSVVILIRVTIGAVILTLFSLRQGTLALAFKNWKFVALYAIGELVMPWYLITNAEKGLSSGLTSLIICTTPIWSSLFAARYGDKTVWQGRRVVGLAVGFAGVILLVGLEAFRDIGNTLSILQVILASAGYAWATNMIAYRIPQVDGVAVNAVAMIMTTLLYLPFAIYFWPKEAPSSQAISSVLALGFFCTAIAFIAFFIAMREMGPARASLVTYLNTLVAVVLGVIILSEPLTIGVIVGLPLVLLGSYWASRKEKPSVKSVTQ